MTGIFFALIIIGLPATFGARMLVKRESSQEQTGGSVLVFFAAVIALAYVFLLPDGRMLPADYYLITPATLIASLVGGGMSDVSAYGSK